MNNCEKRLFLIHTVNQFMDMIYNLFAKPFLEKHPDVDIRNIWDDSLLADNLQAVCLMMQLEGF